MKPHQMTNALLAPLLLAAAFYCTPVSAAVTADDRGVSIETENYLARIVDGSLTGFLNKLTGEEYLAGAAALKPLLPHLPSGLGTQNGEAAYAMANKLLIKPWAEFPTDLSLPNQHYPDAESRFEFKAEGVGGTLRYQGLTDGTERFPEEVYELVVQVDEKTGDLLLTPRATSPEKGVYGVNLTVAPTANHVSVEAPIFDGMRITQDMAPALWRNKWPEFWDYGFVALNGREKGAVGIWTEDKNFQYKDLFFMPTGERTGIALSFASMSVPPYDKLDKADGLTWRVQAFDKNWRQAAARFREWREREIKFAPRPEWTTQVSFVNSGVAAQEQWLDQLKAYFGPEHLDRTVTFAPVIRASAFDTRHWDNSPYEGFKEEMKAWKDSGAKLMAYLQPMIVWGRPTEEEMKDPEIQRIMAAHEDADTRSAFALPPGSQVEFVDQHHLGHKEWQEWFLGCVDNFIQTNDADGVYHDQSYPAPIDSRGLINGMTPPQGMADYFYKAAARNPNSIHGSEHMNEVNSVGASLGIASGILWGEAPNMRWQRILHPSPVTNALHYPRGTLFAFPHFSDFSTRGDARNFHLGMDLQEGRAEIAGSHIQNARLFEGKVAPFDKWLNELKLDRERALLFVNNGLRPAYPVDVPGNVLSNFRGSQGEEFFYEKMPWGTRFVENTNKGPVVHYGRAHGVTHAPGPRGGGGNIAGWIFYNPDGPSGLNPGHYYVLDPDVKKPAVFFSPAFEVYPGAGKSPSFYESAVEDGTAFSNFAWLDVTHVPSVGGIIKSDRINLHTPEKPKAVWVNGKAAEFREVAAEGSTLYELSFMTPARIVVLLEEPEAGFAVENVLKGARFRTVSTMNSDTFDPEWNTGRLQKADLTVSGSENKTLSGLSTPASVFVGEAAAQVYLPVRAPQDLAGSLVLYFRDNTVPEGKPNASLPEWDIDGKDAGRGVNPLRVDFAAGQTRLIRVQSDKAFTVAWDWEPASPKSE